MPNTSAIAASVTKYLNSERYVCIRSFGAKIATESATAIDLQTVRRETRIVLDRPKNRIITSKSDEKNLY